MTVAMTARQRGELAKLRLGHQRARVTVPARQEQYPLVRVRLKWPDHGSSGRPGRRRSLVVWLAPDGRRLLSGELIR
jgi:hypothetical protein